MKDERLEWEINARTLWPDMPESSLAALKVVEQIGYLLRYPVEGCFYLKLAYLKTRGYLRILKERLPSVIL